MDVQGRPQVDGYLVAAGHDDLVVDGGTQPLRMGLIGTGRFGQFCLEQYLTVPQVEVVAVADTVPSRAAEVAEAHGLVAVPPEELLALADVDLIYLGTPPSTHAGLSVRALEAGRHVICEKPLALDVASGRRAVEAAGRAGRFLVVNLIMRYDPICIAVQTIMERRLLGEPLHASFENYAKDEDLPSGHWFWDRSQSGGIFIEHGVHFFDLFSMWFGPGRITSAQQLRRPGTNLVDQVACTAEYGGGVHAAFYHGFHQAARMDRQEIRIVCERGDIRLAEWMPTSLTIDCLAGNPTLEQLLAVVPNADSRCIASYSGPERLVTSRHRRYEVDGRFVVSGDLGAGKMSIYAQAVRALLVDQVTALRHAGHPRLVTEANALASLELAAAADQLARHDGNG